MPRLAQIWRPSRTGLFGHNVLTPARACLIFLLCSVGFVCVAKGAPQRFDAPLPIGKMNAHFAIADFDGDQKADLATVQGSAVTSSQSQYWIRFRLTTGDGQSFGITAPVGGLELSARDVNGDNVPDLVVSTSWLNRPVAILLNNGHGRFALVDPAEFPNVMTSTEAPQGLQPPSSSENVALGLSRGSNDVCNAANLLKLPLQLPETAGQAAPRSPVFPSFLSWHGRAPPACVHHA